VARELRPKLALPAPIRTILTGLILSPLTSVFGQGLLPSPGSPTQMADIEMPGTGF
jgi:hypothetical protein